MAMFNSYVKLPEGILIEATDGIIPSDVIKGGMLENPPFRA